ncbi:MAG: TonB-dependent receptor [Steroidobacteraceae bacterium]
MSKQVKWSSRGRVADVGNGLWPVAALSFTAALSVLAQPALAADADTDAVELAKVVVSARNREEIAQDVPLPVQVIGGAQLDREDIKTIWDLTSKAPNLQLNPPGENARKVSPSIRGLGRGGANDSMEQSVGVIVDGVTLYYSGQAWSDYVDLDRIEVLRGPQGTLMGKNTTLGAINIVTKAPSFTPASSYELSTGDLNTLSGKFSSTGPLVDGVLAYRGTFVVDRADGIYTNTYQSFGHAKETWRESNKIAGRFQLLWTPSDSVSGRFIFDKLRSDERVNTGNVVVSNGPATYADGTARPTVTPIGYTPTGSYANYGYLGKWAQRSAWFHNSDGSVYQPALGTTNIENSEARPQLTNQYGVSSQFDFALENHTLTSITAYRYQDFDIKNGGQNGPFYIGNSGQQLWNDQISQELRLSSTPGAGKRLDYQVGLYYLDAEVYSDDPSYYGQDAGAWNASNAQYTTLIATAAGRELLRKSLDGVYQSSVTDATVQSLAGYAQTDLHLTEKFNLSLGVRQTEEKKQNKITQQLDRAGENLDTFGAAVAATSNEITVAKAVRSGQITAPFGWVKGNDINASLTAWNIGPSYKLTNDVLLYSSVGQGVKSGFIYFQQQRQPTDADFETDIKPEKSFDVELGIKTLLLKGKLQLNGNLYQTKVTDYQASWTRDNPITPGTTISGWGNAPKVLARGLEVESAYQLTKDLSLNASGAYNQATYEAQWLVQTPESATTTYFDARGNQIAGVPKVTFNLGFNYQVSVANHLARVTLSNSYRSGAYLSDNHAAFTYQDAYTVSNLGVGFGSQDRKWELSLLVRNLFDTDYAYTKSTWGSTSAQTQTVGAPRSVTVVFRGKI